MMLSRVRQQSIHRHLAKVGAFITSLVGGVFLVVLLGVSLVSSREELLESTSALISVLASNLTASVAFRDPATAAELLSGLDAVPNVVEAMLFLPDRTAFAYYRPGDLPSANLPDQGYLETLTIPVQLEREQIAT